MLEDDEIQNVDLRLLSTESTTGDGSDSTYVKALENILPYSLDFALIDGMYRDQCTLRAIDLLRPGGVLIIDNVNWFLPSGSYSPGSRTHAQGPYGDIWAANQKALNTWRSIWTTSGVTDTAIFFKPCP